ncbi:hypothetical protein SAY86_001868 [Trapa natans]|uniref:MMS19 nucleotide excision repair protein n=1 Tax=Trapa natans TaxID=22666 RepID=A0AAN7QZ15_TRANT|nr:hypothetical protein SAY86_001868 [Trapa natans]
MAEGSGLSLHVEAYMDTARSPTQQAATLEAIVSLLQNDRLTIEAMAREMGLYLTTTDAIIRARGIFLLAEVLSRLSLKPLDKVTIHSLIIFFAERLADWKAIRGSLIGCLSLMKRKEKVGRVSLDDTKLVLESFLQSIHVQSLGQHDRMLCFELLECLLENYSDAVVLQGNQVVYGICEAIDMEKDPRCLILTFHIVQLAAQHFPDPDGPLSRVAEELFEILGRYFPIHFTHQNAEDIDITRDDLCHSLMMAFCSTPFFEPFAIPLFLEKLSSDLPLAKVDALMYLKHGYISYGHKRMARYAEAIWPLLKDAIFLSHRELVLSFCLESLDNPSKFQNEIAAGVLTFIEMAVRQNDALFLDLILGDTDINLIIKNMNSFRSYTEISSEGKQRLYVVGHILAVSAKASVACCNQVFDSIFPPLLKALGISVKDPYLIHPQAYELVDFEDLNFGTLFLSVLLLEAARDLIMVSEKSNPLLDESISKTCAILARAYCSTLVRNSHQETYDPHIYLSVKGLQIFATFPGYLLSAQENLFEDILDMLVSIITQNFKSKFLWNLALKAIVNIGTYINKFSQSEKVTSFMAIVIEKINSLLASIEYGLPYILKLEAISAVGMIRMDYMLRIIHGIEATLFTSLSELYIYGNAKSSENMVQLMQCYSKKILPWIHESGGTEQIPLQFVVSLFNQIEGWKDFGSGTKEKEVMEVTMEAVKFAVGNCSQRSQFILIEKIYSMLSLSSYFSVKEHLYTTLPIAMESLPLTHDLESLPAWDEWVLSLFASVMIALHPNTRILNLRASIHLFSRTFLIGHISSAQALGSIVNKLCPEQNGEGSLNDCSMEEAIDIIFSHCFIHLNSPSTRCPDKSKISFSDIFHNASTNKSLQINALAGLAWIGKGLLMRGHKKVKDITMAFLEYLLSADGMPSNKVSLQEERDYTLHISALKCIADSFQILMSDSEECLNRKFYAIVRPLYKQRFFSTMLPILQSLIVKCDSSLTRSLLYRAFTHIVCDSPLISVLDQAEKLIPLLLDALLIFSEDHTGRDMMYGLLLVLSGILTERRGQESIIENAPMTTNCLIRIMAYPHMMLVRETAIQCLTAISTLPHSRIYPSRTQVLESISRVLDDPKRAVRLEAVRCRQAWFSLC